VRAFLTSIAEAKAVEIIEDQKQQPAVKNLFTLNLLMDKKNWNAEVGQAADKKIYAKTSEPQFVLKMEPGALDTLIGMTAESFKETPADKPELEKEQP
jgi:hypothetical protein